MLFSLNLSRVYGILFYYTPGIYYSPRLYSGYILICRTFSGVCIIPFGFLSGILTYRLFCSTFPQLHVILLGLTSSMCYSIRHYPRYILFLSTLSQHLNRWILLRILQVSIYFPEFRGPEHFI